jgi:outer membrane lipoprotein-sorting protein
MRPGSRASLVGVALLALGGTASADPKSDALFQKAREALSSAPTLEAEVVQAFEAGDQKGGYTATVRLMKPNIGEVVIKPEGGRPAETTISDGKQIYRISPTQKVYQRSEAGPKGVGGLTGFFMPLKAFFEPEALTAGADYKHTGAKAVDGKSFEVVQFTSTQPPEGVTRYYFGESGLLEGMEIDLKEGDQTGIFRLWLKNLRLNTPLTEKEFAYTPPADFKLHDPFAELNASLLKVGTNAPDFRLPQPDGGALSLSATRKGKKAVLINFWFYG